MRNQLNQRRRDMNAPFNKIRREINKNIKEDVKKKLEGKMAQKEQTKVANIIIPTSKLFRLVRTLKEEREAIPKSTENPKEKLKRYRLKVEHDVLNSMLNNYGIDKLLEKYVHVKELAEAIGEDD